MTTLFFISLFLILYCYFLYPALLWLAARLRPRPVAKASYPAGVSVVLSVYNEEDVIERKLDNLLSLDYPSATVEILIGSDGSTDKTNEGISRRTDPRLRFFPFPERRGKMAVLNELAGRAANEILVFTDARQTFAKDAVVELVKNFSDPAVGCASGELIFSAGEGQPGATGRGIGLYWNYEKFIRREEARLHSMLGATGAIYAIRRQLFPPVPEDVVLDDVYIPFQIIRKGRRAVFDESARAYDAVADSPREEHRRKARTLYGNFQIFRLFPDLFLPGRSPVAIQFFSHKFLRVIVPLLLVGIFILNVLLLAEPGFPALLALQVIFYAMAATGGLARHRKYGIFRLVSRLCYVPYVFCLLNFSALVGFFRFAAGKQGAAWQKARGGSKGPGRINGRF